MEYSLQQSQFPSCQNGNKLKPSKSEQYEHSHTFSGNFASRVLHLPQSTSTQFLLSRGQKAFLDSDILTSGISCLSTLLSKKFSRSSRDAENLLSFFAKFVLNINKDLLTSLQGTFDEEKESEDPKGHHLIDDPSLEKVLPSLLEEDFSRLLLSPVRVGVLSPTRGCDASPKMLSMLARLFWYTVAILFFFSLFPLLGVVFLPLDILYLLG